MKIALISVDGHVSLGIRSISAKLKSAGHTVISVFFPYTIMEVYSDNVLDMLKQLVEGSDIVGISSMAYSSKKAIQVVVRLKTLNIPIVWGGVFPTTCPDACIEHVDMVCIGEGEDAMLDLVNKIEQGRDIRDTMNFLVKDNGKIIRNPLRSLIHDLDSLPFPDYDFDSQYTLEDKKFILMKESQVSGIDSRYCGFTIFNIRGCPYSCSYCVNDNIKSLYKNQKIIRKNSVHYTIRQMKEMKRRFPSIERFRVDDDAFFVRSLEEIKLFSELYKKEIGMPFECNTDPLTINEEKLEILVNTGLKHISMGIQSGSRRILKDVFLRPFTTEMMLNAARIINRHHGKLEVTYDFIVLNPFEEEEDIIQTFNLIQEIPKPFYLSMNCMAFFPGSRIYNRAREMGIIHNKSSLSNKGLWTRFGEIKNIKLSTRNKYLNLIILLLRGEVNSSRYGEIPKRLFLLLMDKKMVMLFNHSLEFITYVFILQFKLAIYIVARLLPDKSKDFLKRLIFIGYWAKEVRNKNAKLTKPISI